MQCRTFWPYFYNFFFIFLVNHTWRSGLSRRSGLLVAWEGEEDRGGLGGAAAPRVLLAVGVRPVREVPSQSWQVLRLPRQPQMVLVIVL